MKKSKNESRIQILIFAEYKNDNFEANREKLRYGINN
jgi:hypothetical protein